MSRTTVEHPDELGFYSRLLHGGLEPDPATGAILTPVYQSTTFVQEGVGRDKGFTYSRTGNPTVAALEGNLGAIEGTPPAVCFRAGMAAISSLLLAVCGSGDEVVVSSVVYGGVVRLLRQIMAAFELRALFVDSADNTAVRAALSDRTRLVLIETPANPTLKLTDIAAVASAVHDAGAMLAVDNTFLTCCLQQPQVRCVTYPWLADFPQHRLARRQQRGGGGMLTFEVHGGGRAARVVLKSLRLARLAENLGAVETLVTHPATMTHAAMEPEERECLGIGDGLIRLSVGLEDPEDLIADLDRALADTMQRAPTSARP